MTAIPTKFNRQILRQTQFAVAALLSGVLTLALTACHGPENKSVQEQANDLASEDPFRVVAVFETPIAEPWVHQIHVALQKAEEELGIEYEWLQNVDRDELDRILREYSEKGFRLIMGDGFGVEEIVRGVAGDYPKVAFAFGSNQEPSEPNFAVFDSWIHEPAYLAGIVAGGMTKANRIGIVAAMPIPEINRVINAFSNGAREVNPDVKLQITFIDSFFDPVKAKAAAEAQIKAGADVVYAERFGVIRSAVEKNILAISNLSDLSELGPDHVITGPIWDVYPTVEHLIQLVRDGRFSGLDLGNYSHMSQGGSYLAPFHKFEERLPPELKQLLQAKTTAILDGSYQVKVDESTPESAD